MISPVLLIAEREFRTYVVTLSFWLSLAIAPLVAGTALFFSGANPPPTLVSIEATNDQLRQSARAALAEAGRLEGKTFVFGQRGTKLVFAMRGPQTLDVEFGADFPLSPTGRALVAHVMERDDARRAARTTFAVHEIIIGAFPGQDAPALSRLVAMLMLWLTLTGSLGMLLQAVVRERANRALESLLAAAQPWQIVAGKIMGVGAVSLLVLAVWLGSVAGLSHFQPPNAGLTPAVLAQLAQPALLARDALIYLCAFAFYGAITVALGAIARDSAAAQNAARPMFALLLVAFFIALSTMGKSAGLPWLVYLPPFTPFLLLVNPSPSVALVSQAYLLGLLLAAALVAMLLAARFLTIAPAAYHAFGANRPKPLLR